MLDDFRSWLTSEECRETGTAVRVRLGPSGDSSIVSSATSTRTTVRLTLVSRPTGSQLSPQVGALPLRARRVARTALPTLGGSRPLKTGDSSGEITIVFGGGQGLTGHGNRVQTVCGAVLRASPAFSTVVRHPPSVARLRL